MAARSKPPFDHIVVALGLHEADAAVLGYASLLSRASQSSAVDLVYVHDLGDLRALRHERPDLFAELERDVVTRLHAVAGAHYAGDAAPTIRSVPSEESRAAALLEVTQDAAADLLVIGKRESGKLAERMARKGPCTVACIPSGAAAKVTKVLCPVDFSEHSAAALRIAADVARYAGLDEVTCLHVFQVPLGHHKLPISYDEFVATMRGYAANSMRDFLHTHAVEGVRLRSELVSGRRPGHLVLDAIAAHGYDLVVMGTSGRTTPASILLGSVAEMVLRQARVPVIAVKVRGDTLRMREVIRRAMGLE